MVKLEIENCTRNLKVEGVKEISNEPNCFVVSLSTIRKNKSVLSPEYYDQKFQSKLVEQALNPCVSLYQIQKRIDEIIKNGSVKSNGCRYPINNETLKVLRLWSKEFEASKKAS